MKPGTLYNVVAHFFILLFIYTAAAKIFEMSQFRLELAESPFLGNIAGFVSWTLPVAEIALVIVLIVPAWRLKGLYGSLFLMTAFTVYLISILLVDDNLSCSCGGIVEELSPQQHLIFNIACIILAGIGIKSAKRQIFTTLSRPRWLSTTFSLILLGSIGWLILAAATAPPITRTGFESKLIPSFDLLLADSTTHLNTKDIPRGKPFILIGFSPYCPHCKKEISDITRNTKKLGDTHVFLVTTFQMNELRAFYKNLKLEQYPNVTIGMDRNNAFLSYFNMHIIPFTAVYDGDKRLVQCIKGEATINTITQCINK